MSRTWPILATLIAACVVSLGSAGLRALHVATAPEHVGHSASSAKEAYAPSACGHSHGHPCGGAADADRADAGTSHSHSNDSHDVDCATCELLATLSMDVALPTLAPAPAVAAGDAPCAAAMQPAMRTLAAVRARPPPTA